MPLPPALAAKLAARGIIKKSDENHKEKDRKAHDDEEIIAEDYDDAPPPPSTLRSLSEPMDKFQGWSPCPNKWNVYHECGHGCRRQWKEPRTMDSVYDKRRLKMLQKHPLPPHWKEMFEPGVARYYYWNTDTNLVAWLPPGHPKCQVSRAAAELRRQMILDRESRMLEEGETLDGSDLASSDEEGTYRSKRKPRRDLSSDSSDGSDMEGRSSKKHQRKHEKKDRNRSSYASGESSFKMASRYKGKDPKRSKKSNQEDNIDPMDPASYSECPRGSWASGLPTLEEARTGVDTTASGQLFQMRPYPSPGSILRANATAGGAGPNKP